MFPVADRAKAWVVAHGGRVGAATLVAGVVDLVWAFSINSAHGVPAGAVLRFIASGLLGLDAFRGGLPVALLGLFCHFVLMGLFASAVALAATQGVRNKMNLFTLGLGAGLALYLVMNFLVLPLSATPPLPPMPVVRALAEVLVHVAVIGPIVAIIVGRSPRAGAKVSAAV